MEEYISETDYLVSAIAADGHIRAFAATTKGMVEEARPRHGTSPVVTAALGRLMTGAAMMGAQMKEAGAKIITLGPRILRTETAGMACLSMCTLMMEE